MVWTFWELHAGAQQVPLAVSVFGRGGKSNRPMDLHVGPQSLKASIVGIPLVDRAFKTAASNCYHAASTTVVWVKILAQYLTSAPTESVERVLEAHLWAEIDSRHGGVHLGETFETSLGLSQLWIAGYWSVDLPGGCQGFPSDHSDRVWNLNCSWWHLRINVSIIDLISLIWYSWKLSFTKDLFFHQTLCFFFPGGGATSGINQECWAVGSEAPSNSSQWVFFNFTFLGCGFHQGCRYSSCWFGTSLKAGWQWRCHEGPLFVSDSQIETWIMISCWGNTFDATHHDVCLLAAASWWHFCLDFLSWSDWSIIQGSTLTSLAIRLMPMWIPTFPAHDQSHLVQLDHTGSDS